MEKISIRIRAFFIAFHNKTDRRANAHHRTDRKNNIINWQNQI